MTGEETKLQDAEQLSYLQRGVVHPTRLEITMAETAVKEEPKLKAAKAPAESKGESTKEARENLPALEGNEAQKPRTKEQLYRQMAGRLNKKVESYFQPVAERVMKKHNEEIKMRQVFGDQDARDLLVLYFQGLFDILLVPSADGTLKEVSIGIPGGFGSVQLTTAGATTKKTPQGQVVEVHKRWRVKYSPGKSVDERLAQLPAPPPDEPTPETPETPEAAAAPAPAAPAVAAK